jgi:membrane-associated phospholipid phosphatase
MNPRPRLYLFLALLCTSLFALLAVLLEAGALGPLDARFVAALHSWAIDHPPVLGFFTFVTDLGAGRPLFWVGTFAVFALAWRREWFRSLVWLVGLLASRPVTPWFKGQFGRVRPPFIDWPDFSFPSGHAFGSAVTYGMFALVVLRVWHGSRWRWVFAGALWAFIGFVALSRPILGVHYPSDVVAGVSLGMGWGFYWAAVADWWDLRRLRGSAERVEQTQDPP